MNVVDTIKEAAAKAIKELYKLELTSEAIAVNATKPEFEGDYTIVLFGFVKQLKQAPDALGNALGKYLVENNASLFRGYNIIKGFLNLSITDNYWLSFLQKNNSNTQFGFSPKAGKKVLVEYSSPNTNKPLHLGHLRNNFLGWSTAEIMKANGNDIVKTCVVNDRGIHICKSMVAWVNSEDKKTPQKDSLKGDHLVGEYYVRFETVSKKETAEMLEQLLQNNDASLFEYDLTAKEKTNLLLTQLSQKEQATEAYNKILDDIKELVKNNTPIMIQAREMLKDWEAGKPEVIELWKMMNEWVYAGFDETYKTIGSDFDKVYYESKTYLLGKDLVQKGLSKGVFYQKEDNSVWIDLTADGLDEKIVQRKDGTSVYITQDIGLVEQRQEEYNPSQSIYVVGDEQNYHFKVLKLICQKLGLPSADGIFHLSYGMVELPTGKMKSREGTVVDADELVAEMIEISKQKTEELGKVKDFTEEELKDLYYTIGLGALKFFLLRVDPKKKMIFNPEESIDFHGFTGPFVQYTYARIKSVLRKIEIAVTDWSADENHALLPAEKNLLIHIEQFTTVIEESAANHDPSKIAIYVFELAQLFNSFYTNHSIASAESVDKKALRLQLATLTAHTLKSGMGLLGINVPERM